MLRIALLALLFLLGLGGRAQAGVALLLEEPFGHFGGLNPTGHAAIYLSRVCAASPLQLRPCVPGEAGVVISRYYKVGGHDAIAIPLIAYLYAVDAPESIPGWADASIVAGVRDTYRRRYLADVVPDDAAGQPPRNNWTQLVGAAYDRKIYGYEVETTREQDEQFIRWFNGRRNRSSFNLLFHNCADYARLVLNQYYPGSAHRSLIADGGMTTPKQVAKSLVAYGRHHPELELSAFVIPQVSGPLGRSAPVKGVAETFIKTKKYLIPIAVLHPFIAGGMVAAWVSEGRFNPKRNAVVFDLDRAFRANLPDEPQRPWLTTSSAGPLTGISGLGALVSAGDASAGVKSDLPAPSPLPFVGAGGLPGWPALPMRQSEADAAPNPSHP